MKKPTPSPPTKLSDLLRLAVRDCQESWAAALETEGASWVFEYVRNNPRRPYWMTPRERALRVFVRRLCRHIRD